MTIPTVFMVGVERLPLVPEYLNLGSVVVVAPDQETLRRWTWEQFDLRETSQDENGEPHGTVVGSRGAPDHLRWSHPSVERSRVPGLERPALALRSGPLVPGAARVGLG